MDLHSLYLLADAILIAPFRWFDSAHLSFWCGSIVLALWCLFWGELTLSLIYLTNRRYYAALNAKMVRMHNISIKAILSKDKTAFKAANKWANEYFGKLFFSQAAVFAVSIWPLPFAMAWLQTRFEGIPVHTVPYTSVSLGYSFVLLVCYIVLRYGLSRVRHKLPLLRTVEAMRKEDSREAGEMRSWGDLGKETEKPAEQDSAPETHDPLTISGETDAVDAQTGTPPGGDAVPKSRAVAGCSSDASSGPLPASQ